MTRTPVNPSDVQPCPESIRFGPVEQTELLAAAQRLTEASAGGDRDAGRRFLDAAKAHRIDLSNLWASSDSETGRIREVVLGVRGSGRTAMFFTSLPSNREAEVEVGRLLDLSCTGYEKAPDAGVRLAQTLLSPGEHAAARAFVHGGFHELSRLAYLSRPVPQPSEFDGYTPWQLPEGVRAVSLSDFAPDFEGSRDRLLAGLTRSYEQTLDCPELCDLRKPEDVLDSHRSVGRFDPKWWWIIEEHGQAEGAMLFTACPELGSVELVYLGLSPALRGRGIAKVLMRSGMRELAFGLNLKSARGRQRGNLTCAVDLKNDPARGLYRSLGFQMTAERIAFVRAIG